MTLKSPYPYFGGKSKIAAEVWKRFGNTPNYVEPFFGSGAVLLARPHKPGLELVNDVDNEDDGSLHIAVRDWAIANGDNPQLRIAYCGYDDGFDFPTGWKKFAWKANGGYSNQGENRRGNATRETVWFSPHCVEAQLMLFGDMP